MDKETGAVLPNQGVEAYTVYVVSDALGETAEFVCRAATSQFAGARTKIRKIPYVRDVSQIDELMADAADENAIVLYTLVVDELSKYLQEQAEERSVVAVDVLGPLVDAISTRIQRSPKSVPNITNRLDADYFKKIEAIEFAVKYDDGKDPRGVLYSDVTLIGISRTSKTPLSMYLAHKGIKVANIPLVPEVAPPRELFLVPSRKVFGLVLDPNKLNEIRGERLKTLGLGVSADYASIDRIMEELYYGDQIIKKVGCMVINTTHRAIEETASIILHKIYKGE
ncbi:MAG: kinase/pyrophosphorylase [Peptococcaceae bacterium]|nr:kinase/pyrophosphorylase [Peptococcaceae bacterium]